MNSQVLYIVTAYCMFWHVMFSIFKMCSPYFVGKAYHTVRLTNQHELYIDDATLHNYCWERLHVIYVIFCVHYHVHLVA